MQAIILAAGYATRLYPLTLDTPKCLLSLGGTTILDILAEKLSRVDGLDKIIISTNAKFYEQLESWRVRAKSRPPTQIINNGTLSNETRLGAIGDLNFTIKECRIADDILMLASDNLFDAELGDFICFARSKKNAASIGLYDIKKSDLASKKFGVVEVDRFFKVTRIEEKPENPRSRFIGMGIYYFPKTSLRFVGDYLSSAAAKDAPGHYVRWLLGKISIFGFLFSGMWYDIGDFKALEEADKILSRKSQIQAH